MKLTDQCARHEIAGRENEGPICRAWNCRTWTWRTRFVGHKSTQPENAGHEIAGQNSVTLHYYEVRSVVCCCYFLRHKHYNTMFVS